MIASAKSPQARRGTAYLIMAPCLSFLSLPRMPADVLICPKSEAFGSKPSTTTHRRPDVALAFFFSARHASTGAGSRIRAKGGIGTKTPVSAVVPLSALSVLCFCERRLSHDPQCFRGFPAASLNDKSGGEGDRLRSATTGRPRISPSAAIRSGDRHHQTLYFP